MRSVSRSLPFSTRVLRNVISGLALASRKSFDRKCSSRRWLLVFMLAALIVAETEEQ